MNDSWVWIACLGSASDCYSTLLLVARLIQVAVVSSFAPWTVGWIVGLMCKGSHGCIRGEVAGGRGGCVGAWPLVARWIRGSQRD